MAQISYMTVLTQATTPRVGGVRTPTMFECTTLEGSIKDAMSSSSEEFYDYLTTPQTFPLETFLDMSTLSKIWCHCAVWWHDTRNQKAPTNLIKMLEGVYETMFKDETGVALIKVIADAYAKCYVMGLLFDCFVHATDELFSINGSYHPHLHEEWRVYTLHNITIATPDPYTILRLYHSYPYYASRFPLKPIRDPVNIRAHFPKTGTKVPTTPIISEVSTSTSDMIKTLPKRYGLDAKNIQETYLRKRRTQSNKFL